MSITTNGLRIRGDELGADADCHRARYRWARDYLRQHTTVLDYGCGSGYGTAILDERHFVLGYDADPVAVKYVRERRPTMVTGTEPRGPFGAVVCFEVLEHLEQHPTETLKHLLTLAPVVIASVPYLEERGNNVHHRWFGLCEQHFPGCEFRYQHPDGTIDSNRDGTQNLVIVAGARV